MNHGPIEYCEIVAHCPEHPNRDLDCPTCIAESDKLWAEMQEDEENQG